jgi:hypothetical protein
MALQELLAALSVRRALAESSEDALALRAGYKASCRIDELFFKNGSS